jgi:hypothetical protein
MACGWLFNLVAREAAMFKIRGRIGAVALAFVAVVMLGSDARAQFLFWSDGNGVHRVNAADGADPRDFSFLAQNLLVGGGKLYSIFENQVSVSDLDGKNLQPAPTAPQTVQDFLRGVVRDAQGRLYTPSASDQQTILRDGDPVTAASHRFSPPMTLQYEPIQDKIYWMGGWNDLVSGLLERDGPDGGNVQTLLGPDLLRIEDYTTYFSIDVPGGWVYWATTGADRIRRAPLVGTANPDDVREYTVAAGVWAVAASPTPEPAGVVMLVPALALRCRRSRR